MKVTLHIQGKKGPGGINVELLEVVYINKLEEIIPAAKEVFLAKYPNGIFMSYLQKIEDGI